MNNFDSLLESLPRVAPRQIDALWSDDAVRHNGVRVGVVKEHELADNLPTWAPDASIAALLQSRSRCSELVEKLATAALNLGMIAKQLPSGNTILLSPCLGCNTCWDNAGCEHGSTPPRSPLQLHGERWEAEVIVDLHQSVKLLGLLCNLLARPDSNILAQEIVREAPSGVSPLTFFFENIEDPTSQPLLVLVGMLDNAARPFPQAAHLTASALSLVVSRRPSVALSALDPETFAKSIFEYMGESIFPLINNSGCRIEEYFGVIAFINFLPLLYFLGDWKEANLVLPKYQLPSFLASMALNILHAAATDDAWDSPPDTNLGGVHVWIAPLIESTEMAATVLRERPMTFVVAASIEILGRWANKRVPVSQDHIPVIRGPPATVASSLQEYEPMLKTLIARTPAIAPLVRPIVKDLVEGNRPSLPAHGTSLLHDPLLRASLHCALGSCNRTSCENGERLRRCSGGCGGLARYCSSEHQHEHWAQHKFFCKRQPSTKKKNSGGAATR